MPKRKPSRAADKLRPIVRKVSVEFTLTDESLKELGDHLRVRGLWASAGMDTLTTADHICFAVFAKARADIPNAAATCGEPSADRRKVSGLVR